MPLLQVRDFPDDIYDEISFEARRQNRTIAQQTIVLIKKGLGGETSNRERRKRAVEKSFSRNVPQEAFSEGINNARSIYDMLYMVAARRNDAVLLTTDSVLINICRKNKIKVAR